VAENDELHCQWMVGMTELESGSPRFGYGTYHWKFSSMSAKEKSLVQQLTITIAKMDVLPVNSGSQVLPWLSTLTHPWTTFAEIASSAPDLPEVHDFLETCL